MSKALVEFTKHILSAYNATPDEWDEFNSIVALDDTKDLSILSSENLKLLDEQMGIASQGNVKSRRLVERAKGDIKRIANSWWLNLVECAD